MLATDPYTRHGLADIDLAGRRSGGFDAVGSGDMFHPLMMVPSPVIWLDAADRGTMFDATSGGGVVADSGVVRRWENKIVNQYHFYEEAGFTPPSVIKNVTNGLAAVYFSAYNPLIGPSIFNGKIWTVFMVFKRTALAPIHGGVIYCGWGAGDTVLGFSTDSTYWTPVTAGDWGYANNLRANPRTDFGASPTPTFVVSGSRGPLNLTTTDKAIRLGVQLQSNGGRSDVLRFTGYIHEVIICEGPVSELMRFKLTRWLSLKYGVILFNYHPLP